MSKRLWQTNSNLLRIAMVIESVTLGVSSVLYGIPLPSASSQLLIPLLNSDAHPSLGDGAEVAAAKRLALNSLITLQVLSKFTAREGQLQTDCVSYFG